MLKKNGGNIIKVSKSKEIEIRKKIKRLTKKSNQMYLDLTIPDEEIYKIDQEIQNLIDSMY